MRLSPLVMAELEVQLANEGEAEKRLNEAAIGLVQRTFNKPSDQFTEREWELVEAQKMRLKGRQTTGRNKFIMDDTGRKPEWKPKP